jgi:radical SAM protein with 4Fe4S-binding SPASM domain
MSERRARVEAFGAIVQLVRPRALVFVDRARARSLGLRGAWRGPEPGIGDQILSAPLEAHLQITNRCEVGCAGCYTGASPEGAPREWGLVEWKRAIDELARMGVFHLALGGGESATVPWLGELAAHARARGLVPNLTTSGLYGLDNVLANAHLFGQINVSLDGLGLTYKAVRGIDGFARADAALCALRAVKREIGINVVVTRHNFDELDAIFLHAKMRKLSEVELLRMKPSGRGAAAYAGLACTQAQYRALLPTILAGARRTKLRVRVDCSYVPMLAHHAPSRDLLASLAVYGCTAGDFLVAAKATGAATACSFLPPDLGRPKIDQLSAHWTRPDAFATNRGWRDAAEPCRSCTYFDLCRGGCKVVSGHAGDARAPDPECPRVVDHRAREGARRARLPIAR